MTVRVKNIIEACVFIALGITARLIPHLPNMTPVGAIALRSRARFGTWGLTIPIVSMVDGHPFEEAASCTPPRSCSACGFTTLFLHYQHSRMGALALVREIAYGAHCLLHGRP